MAIPDLIGAARAQSEERAKNTVCVDCNKPGAVYGSTGIPLCEEDFYRRFREEIKQHPILGDNPEKK